jgi:hypothetical protein
MIVTMDLSKGFANIAGLPNSLEANGNTIKECLADLARNHPKSKKWIFDKKGKPMVFVYLNQGKSDVADLNTAIKEGDVLTLVMMLGGG